MRAAALPVLWAGLVCGSPLAFAGTADRTTRPPFADAAAEDKAEDEDDANRDADDEWEKEGENQETGENWVKVDTAAPPPRLPKALPMKAIGLGTVAVGALLVARGLMLRASLKNEVQLLSAESAAPPTEWPDEITSLQSQTNAFLWAGLTVGAVGSGVAVINPTAARPGSMSLHAGWSRRW